MYTHAGEQRAAAAAQQRALALHPPSQRRLRTQVQLHQAAALCRSGSIPDRFRDGLPGEAVRPGFTLVTVTEGSSLVGATYEWTMSAGNWWSRADAEPPARIRAASKLAVMEWIVHPQRRGEGFGAEPIR